MEAPRRPAHSPSGASSGAPVEGVVVEDSRFAEAATALAAELGLPVLVPGAVDPPAVTVLALTAAGLELRASMGTLRVDFLSGPQAVRAQRGSGHREPLGRALGLRAATPTRTVIDATAGLGRDAFLLASLGVEVTAVERHPVVGALVRDALERGARNRDLAEWMARIRLRVDDAREVIAGLPPEESPDAIYLDPMFPPRRKSSLVKKEMRILSSLVGGTTPHGDVQALLRAALEVAKRRVVVKRPADAPPICDAPRAPNLSIQGGRTTRYDVWLC